MMKTREERAWVRKRTHALSSLVFIREFHSHIHCLTPQEESNLMSFFAKLDHLFDVV